MWGTCYVNSPSPRARAYRKCTAIGTAPQGLYVVRASLGKLFHTIGSEAERPKKRAAAATAMPRNRSAAMVASAQRVKQRSVAGPLGGCQSQQIDPSGDFTLKSLDDTRPHPACPVPSQHDGIRSGGGQR